MRYMFHGMRTFTKIETAAQFALDKNINPEHLRILEEGKVRQAEQWEISELCAYMRDLAPPC